MISFVAKLKIRTRIAIGFALGNHAVFLHSYLCCKCVCRNGYQESAYCSSESINNEANKSLVLLLNRVNMVSVSLFENQEMQDLIVNDTLPIQEKKNRYKEIVDNLHLDTDLIGDIAIIDEKGNIYQYSEGKSVIPEPEESFVDQIRNSKKIGVLGKVVQDSNKAGYILYGKKFRSFYSDGERGYLIFYIKETAIRDEYKDNLESYGSSFILSGNDEVISSPDVNKLGTTLFDGSPFVYNGKFRYFTMDYEHKPAIITVYKFFEELQDFDVDWRIITVIPRDKLFELTDKVKQYTSIIWILMSIVAVILSFSISNNITKPVKALGEKLKSFGQNQMVELHFARNSGDEIWELEESYNHMIVRINDLIERNNIEKEKQRELELIALQAQINPHFLYNTLDSIGWMAKLKNQESIWTLVMALSKFFRISLHKGEYFITVDKEIELVKSFMTITQIRFPNKFDVTYEIDEDCLDCKMLTYVILQPLVENAVKHGISPMEGFGHITIRGWRSEEGLVFEVTDDGVGFNAEKDLSSGEKDLLGGYGIKKRG